MAIFNSYVSLPEGNLRLPGLQFWHSHSDLSSGPCLGEEFLFRRQSKMTSALGSAFRTGMPTQFWGPNFRNIKTGAWLVFHAGNPKKWTIPHTTINGWYSNHLQMASLLWFNPPKRPAGCTDTDHQPWAMEKTHPYQTIWYHALSSPSLINYIISTYITIWLWLT